MSQTERTYNPAPTVEQIQADAITQLSVQYWAPFGNVPKLPFNAQIIEDIYEKELIRTKFLTRRIMILEFGQYLENYLWPNYSKNASKAHVMSIIAMVNEKCRERVQAWECFESSPENFSDFFHRSMELSLDETLTFQELCVAMTFFINAFNNLGNHLIRKYVQKLTKLTTWSHVTTSMREEVFEQCSTYKKYWKRDMKVLKSSSDDKKSEIETEAAFVARHVRRFFSVLDGIKSEGPIEASHVSYCERFLEWMIDIQTQISHRRFLSLLLDSMHVVVKCRMSGLVKRDKEGHLFRQLLDMFQFYCRFEINDRNGEALTDEEMMANHYNKITKLQKIAFKNFEELKRLSMSHVAGIDQRKSLLEHLDRLSNKGLHDLAARLNLVDEADDSRPEEFSSEFLKEVLVYHLERRQSQLDRLNEMPLYPTEAIVWDENVVPSQYHGSDNRQAASGGLALPKLNLLFLTIHDYLLRNFDLFRLESTYEIRQDIEDAVFRMKPWLGCDGSCSFGGWARMAHPIEGFAVVEVAKPNVGENHPARVKADLTVNLRLRSEIRREWEGLRKHDIVFLITLRPLNPSGTPFDYKKPFLPQVGLVYVRGCEVEGMLDDTGKVIEEGMEPKPVVTGDSRTFRVILDPNQYQRDIDNITKGAEDPYVTFNVVMRRKPKENNFKAVLETIRDLMNTQCVVPNWLQDHILGYGEMYSAHYTSMPGTLSTLDWNDTFLDFRHLRSCFTDHKVMLKKFASESEAKRIRSEMDVQEEEDNTRPPYKLTFCETEDENTGNPEKTILVEPYVHINRGPYLFNQPKRNQIPFTKTQVEAIRSGMQPGLTMVVGPPGTGKTDVAVQIISNIYHNFPDQRTLIVTHSNQALNQLFEKIMCLDIEKRHLLRLGHGEEELETDKDYSRYGRVNFVLSKRLELLAEVKRLQVSLDMPLYQEHTCESAGYFFTQIQAKYEEFQMKARPKKLVEEVSKFFPFHKFFEDAPQPLFKGASFDEDMEIAQGCFRYIGKIFSQLEEFRPFELLRNGRDRVRYLLIKEAKIIAMTCTHAALKRRDLVEAGFQYENILMEESAQILEIETFIPLLLQNPEHGQNRLKRWIMIGDHHQLPPVIKNMAFQKFSNMEQSLFTRFVKIGYPTVDLDAQGRSRPSICKLFSWRYKNLGNLPHLTSQPEYLRANPGFSFDYQLVDVQDFNGVGESEPNPFFYQNLAEAEYICSVYIYLRLLGYPAERISILTTYNGQKHLIRDVIQERCAKNSLLGKPHTITTVDRYQGQQNDIILLSLVRTKNVGHLRDIRRLVVAMSRARLGLYIFARVSLFMNCLELKPTFSQLMAQPLKLHLQPMENYGTIRPVDHLPDCPPLIIQDMPHMTQFVHNFYRDKAQGFLREYEQQQQLLRKEAEERAKEQEASNDRLAHKLNEEYQGDSSDEEVEDKNAGDDKKVEESEEDKKTEEQAKENGKIAEDQPADENDVAMETTDEEPKQQEESPADQSSADNDKAED